jgi:HEAT repeat protein
MRMVSIVVLSGILAGGLAAQEPSPPPPVPKPAPVPARPRVNPPRALVPILPPLSSDLEAATRELQSHLDEAAVRAQVEELSALQHLQLDELRSRAEELGARVAAELGVEDLERMAEELGRLDSWRPRQGTPEDSLYRSARESLNRGEYARAAALFQSLEQKYPRSRFAPSALYYQAFALYRSGSVENLRAALEALRTQQQKYPDKATDPDVGALRTRVYAALAARGDASAAAALRAATSSGSSCDEEDMSVRAEALNALTQLDPENAAAALKRVLARRDECSVSLRRRAVYLLGRTGTEQAAGDLVEVARTDPDPSVRSDAISQLGRSPFASVNSAVLLQLFGSAEDEQTRQAILAALRSRGGPEARAALRSIAARSELPERIRAQAIVQLGGGSSFSSWLPDIRGAYMPTAVAQAAGVPRSPVSVREAAGVAPPLERGRGEALEEEDAAFLRDLYPKTDSRTIKSAILSVLGRAGGTPNDQWLMGILQNPAEDNSLRREALARMKSLSAEDLGRLYDGLSEREFRTTIVSKLAEREEPRAVDKLIEIAKTSTDPRVRSQAIQALTRRKDPKATAFIRDLVEKP